ncbi:hypothetical protein ILUMI_15778, partial [Ignelater luminosus]
MGFTCAVVDCPEWLQQSKPGCYFKHELDKCCTVGEVCGQSNVTCKVDGKTYRVGEQFSPSNNKCTRCICQNEFAGKYEAPFCKKRSCIEEIDRQKEINNFCAPTYTSNNDCCPFSWICPETKDAIVVAKTPSKHP